MLPEFTEMVDGMLGSALEQLATLQTCVDRPGVLDDHTLNRFIVLHTEQLDDHWLYEEQFARWKRGTLDQVEAKGSESADRSNHKTQDHQRENPRTGGEARTVYDRK